MKKDKKHLKELKRRRKKQREAKFNGGPHIIKFGAPIQDRQKWGMNRVLVDRLLK